MDPVRSNFHDFPPDLAVSNLHSLHICYIESIYLLYENQIVSSAEKLELLLQGRVARVRYRVGVFERQHSKEEVRQSLYRIGSGWD